jgi:zinc/manganese transport system substrate-binding protein
MNRFLMLLAAICPASVQAALTIVTTTPDLAALARDVAGSNAVVISICRPNENPHFIEAKPSHIVTLNKADVLIEVGLELEIGWLPALLEQTRNPRIQPGRPGRINAGQYIAPLDVPSGPVTRSQGDVHALGNPHYLLDPVRAQQVVRAIADRLKVVDAGRADVYETNAAALQQRIETAFREAQAKLAPYRNAKIVTHHRSLTYLADRFGLVVVNTIEPKPGIAPSPAHITAVTEQMKSESIRLILLEPWYERRIPDLIAAKTGAKVVLLPLAGESPARDYAATLQEQARQITEALK